MKQYSNPTSMCLAALGLAASLAACGGDSATVELKLMDAPPEGVTAVNIWVASMQVHVAEKDDDKGDDDDGWSSLTVDRSIDLVQHQGESAAEVLGQLPLPEGKITQIRLVLDSTKPNTAVKDGMSCDLDMSRVEAKGVKINHPFKAFDAKAGAKHEVIVDVPLDESMSESGACYRLEPKLKLHKVKIDGKDFDAVVK